MLKIAILLCAVFLTSTKCDAPEHLIDGRKIIDVIEVVKEQIDKNMDIVYEDGFMLGDVGKDRFFKIAEKTALRLNKILYQDKDKLCKLMAKVPDAVKQECDVFDANLEETTAIITYDDITDCILWTIDDAVQSFAQIFRYARYGKAMLNTQKKLAGTCSGPDCRRILHTVHSISNETLTNIGAKYKIYVDTIGNEQLVDECLHKNMADLHSNFVNIIEKTLTCLEQDKKLRVSIDVSR